jgi:hypothetical protein
MSIEIKESQTCAPLRYCCGLIFNFLHLFLTIEIEIETAKIFLVIHVLNKYEKCSQHGLDGIKKVRVLPTVVLTNLIVLPGDKIFI